MGDKLPAIANERVVHSRDLDSALEAAQAYYRDYYKAYYWGFSTRDIDRSDHHKALNSGRSALDPEEAMRYSSSLTVSLHNRGLIEDEEVEDWIDLYESKHQTIRLAKRV